MKTKGLRLWPSLHALYVRPRNIEVYLASGICAQPLHQLLDEFYLPFTDEVWTALQEDMRALLQTSPFLCAQCMAFVKYVEQEGCYQERYQAKIDYLSLALTEYDPYRRRLRQEGDVCRIGTILFEYMPCECGFRLPLPRLLQALFGFQSQECCAAIKEELLASRQVRRALHRSAELLEKATSSRWQPQALHVDAPLNAS